MLFRVRCPTCRATMRFDSERDNPKVRCPRCRTKFRARTLEVLEQHLPPPASAKLDSPPQQARRPAPKPSPQRARRAAVGWPELIPADRPAPPRRPAGGDRPTAPDAEAALRTAEAERMAAGRGPVDWILLGVRDGVRHAPVLLATLAVMVLLTSASSLLCGVGELLVAPALWCGLCGMVVRIARGEGASVGQLFKGFDVVWRALGLGLIFDVIVAVVALVVWVPIVGVIATGMPVLLALVVPLYFGLVYLLARLGFAFTLLLDRNAPIGTALSGSWRMSAGLPFVVFFVLMCLCGLVLSSAVAGASLGLMQLLGGVEGIILAVFAGLVGLCVLWSALVVPWGHAYNSLVRKRF